MSHSRNGHPVGDPLRLPPHHLEAERGVLGSMLLDCDTIDAVMAILAADDFYRDTHQVVCRAIFSLHARHRGGVDLLTVSEELKRTGQLDRIGGDDALADLVNAVPHAAHARYYAQIVHQKAIGRKLIEADEANLADAYADSFTADELADRAAKRFAVVLEMRSERDRRKGIFVTMSDVESKPVDWLWPGRIPLGMTTLFAGDPGLGKSMTTLAVAAAVTRGAPFPDDPHRTTTPGSVILLTAEDALDYTIKPRLEAYGADSGRVHVLTMVRRPNGKEAFFSLKEDLAALEDGFVQFPDTRLIVIDPISSYLGGADEHRNAEVRTVLGPLAKLVERHKVALVIVGHLNKGSGGKAVYRAMGSLAFIAAARISWLFVKDAEDPLRRLMVSPKCNVAAEPTGLAYRIVDGILQWEARPVEITAEDALQAEGKKREDDMGQLDKAKTLLEELLADGQRVGSDELLETAKAKGISRGTMYKAKEALGIKAKKVGFGPTGQWSWALPEVDVIPYPSTNNFRVDSKENEFLNGDASEWD